MNIMRDTKRLKIFHFLVFLEIFKRNIWATQPRPYLAEDYGNELFAISVFTIIMQDSWGVRNLHSD